MHVVRCPSLQQTANISGSISISRCTAHLSPARRRQQHTNRPRGYNLASAALAVITGSTVVYSTPHYPKYPWGESRNPLKKRPWSSVVVCLCRPSSVAVSACGFGLTSWASVYRKEATDDRRRREQNKKTITLFSPYMIWHDGARLVNYSTSWLDRHNSRIIDIIAKQIAVGIGAITWL